MRLYISVFRLSCKWMVLHDDFPRPLYLDRINESSHDAGRGFWLNLPSVGSLKLSDHDIAVTLLARLVLVPIHVPAATSVLTGHPVIDECQKREPSTRWHKNSSLATFDGLIWSW